MQNWTSKTYRKAVLTLVLMAVVNLVIVLSVHLVIRAVGAGESVPVQTLLLELLGDRHGLRVDMIITVGLVVAELLAGAWIRRMMHGDT